MTIQPIDDPVAARNVAYAALPPLPPAPLVEDGSRPLAAPLSTVGAIPLYNISLEALAEGQLDAAFPTGWRYVRPRPGSSIGDIVEVSGSPDDAPTLASVATGELASRIIDAGARASHQLDGHDAKFDARILRLPELHLETLWLCPNDRNHDKDRFYAITGTTQELETPDFLPLAQQRAREELRRRPDMSPDTSRQSEPL